MAKTPTVRRETKKTKVTVTIKTEIQTLKITNQTRLRAQLLMCNRSDRYVTQTGFN